MLPGSELSQSQSQKLPDTCPADDNTQISQTWQSHKNRSSPWGFLYPLISGLKIFEMKNDKYTVGRMNSNDMVLGKGLGYDEAVLGAISKVHFRLRREVDREQSLAYLDDLSFNGTFINGTKVGKGNTMLLTNNDEISVAFSNLKMFIYINPSLDPEVKSYPDEVRSRFEVSRKLGAGACGEVKLVFGKLTGKSFAMKIIQKRRFGKENRPAVNNMKKIDREIDILRALKHPMIVRFEDVIHSPERVFIITEYVEGGELFERIQTRKMKEDEVKMLFYQLALAVKYLHMQGIIHRDIKPENILLTSNNTETLVKLSDFGLSKFIDAECMMMTLCGSPMYIAPEVLVSQGNNGTYGQPADLWSMGVVLYVCLSGLTPFSSACEKQTLSQQILSCNYSFPPSHWRGISSKAKMLVRRLMALDPKKRYGLNDVLNHPWLKDRTMTLAVKRLLDQQKIVPTTQTSGDDTDQEEDEEEGTRPLKKLKLDEDDTIARDNS